MVDQSPGDPNFQAEEIAWQFGCRVSLVQPNVVLKKGMKVRPAEEIAMKLVQEYLPDIPVPKLHGWGYNYDEHGAVISGQLYMDYVPGRTLSSAWANLDDVSKGRLCQEIWDIVARLRTIQRPDDLEPGCYRTVDGSPCRDPLLGSNSDPAPREFDDESLRQRIFARYVNYNGLSYRDGEQVPDKLPRSNTSVFTHGDLMPKNIMLDDNNRIVAILDWESSGWFPDYWEFAMMQSPCLPQDREYKAWMRNTKPEPWDVTGILMARRVLF